MNDSYLTMQKVLDNYQKQFQKSQQALQNALQPTLQLQQKIIDMTTSPLLKKLQKRNDELLQTLSKSFEKSFCDNFHIRLMSNAELSDILREALSEGSLKKLSSESTDALNESISNISTDDYVIFEESVAKEWDISENIALSIGNNKVKMKTSDFITVLSILIPMLVNMICFGIEQHNALSDSQLSEQQLEATFESNKIEEERNQLLTDFLYSIDVSHSSEKDSIIELSQSIEALTEALQVWELDSPDSGSTLDASQETDCNDLE